MQNRPVHELTPGSDGLDATASGRRLVVVGCVLVSVMVVILGRVVWLQNSAAAEFRHALQKTDVEYEIIPARDGRIRTESQVLATDVDRYGLSMHYRWLQEPADATWLRRQVRLRLSAAERSDPAAERATMARIEAERAGQWESLADLASVSSVELNRTREQIQSRVERIADSVNGRRTKRDEPPSSATDPAASRPGASLTEPLVDWISAVRRELTTPPHRGTMDRIVVREEEDFHTILEDVPLEVAAAIREQPSRFPGIEVVVTTQRVYPHQSLAAHSVGTRTALRDAELEESAPRPVSGDGVRPRRGRSGVELTWNHRLQGTPGVRRIVRNRRQEIVEIVDERKPVSGQDVLLTLNPQLQQIAERLLDESLGDLPRQQLPAVVPDGETDAEPELEPVGGCILVMDIHSGRLLAAASAPTFDLNLYQGGSESAWQKVRQDQRKPLFSRITGMAIPPGSVFKTIAAIAMVESETTSGHETFQCHGYLHDPDHHRCLIFRKYGVGHGAVSLTSALSQSCNVYFFSAAERMGPQPLIAWSQRFGIGQRTDVDLPFESSGQLTRGNGRIDPLGLAIGQDGLTTTPLQIVRLMGAVANDGWLVTPHIVSQDGIARSSEETDDRPRQLTRRHVAGLSPDTLAKVRAGLADVVGDPAGTAYRTVRLDTVTIAGKTGTAQSGTSSPDHAWFAGYTPAESPQYAFVVVLENGGSGSRAAGPVARELVNSMLQLNLLPAESISLSQAEADRSRGRP